MFIPLFILKKKMKYNYYQIILELHKPIRLIPAGRLVFQQVSAAASFGPATSSFGVQLPLFPS